MVNIYVGNTDNNWFDFLSSRNITDEVNFWKPSTGNFKAVGEGERFAFRLKAPRSKIGGFGTFAKGSALPIQIAWEAFGIRNGVGSLSDFVATIAKYRTEEIVTPSKGGLTRNRMEFYCVRTFTVFSMPVTCP